LDQRSDIYSLGAILYQILTLAPPYTGKSARAILEKVTDGRLVPPSRRAPGRNVPPELEAAVTKAMAPDPESRYQDVAAFRADIEAYLAGGRLAAARYSPWQLAAKWVRRHKPLAIGTAAVAAALLAGGIGIAVAMASARRTAEQEERVNRARTAEDAFARAREDWLAAEEIPFNPAAPEKHFRAHLEPLFEMGRALQGHPSPAPEGWAAEVARRADELRKKAIVVSDWTLAHTLARSVLTWAAATKEESDERVEAVDEAQAEAAREDVERLEAILAKIRAATGEGRSGGLLPGELGEEALRLARSTGNELTGRAIEILEVPDLKLEERLFLVELLGRKGDALTRSGGVSTPELATKALAQALEDADPLRAALTSTWIAAAVRLEARVPGSLTELRELLGAVREKHESPVPMVAQAASRGIDDLDALTQDKPLPPLATSEEAYRRELDELADIWAARARSAGNYTRALLEKARAPLAPEEKAFVLGQLGLHGDKLPPDPAANEIAAIPVLQRCFATAFPERDRGELEPAIAAANALSRLGDGSFSAILYQCRYDSGQHSVFWNRTLLAFGLLAALSKEPRTAADYVERGLARRAQNDLAGAIEDYGAAIRLAPNYAVAYNNRGAARQEQKDLAGAIEDYGAAIRLDPNYAVAYNNRGNARSDQKDLAGAIEDYSTAIRLDPNYAAAYNNRGLARQDQEDLAGAIEDCSTAIRLDPNNAAAYNNRGNARREQKDLARAIEDCSTAIRLDPNYAAAYNNRGAARYDQNDLAGAIEDFSTAIRLDPNFAEAYTNRGNARGNQKDLAGAIEDWSTAIRLDPEHWRAWTNRGIALAKLGRRDEAAESFRRALEVCPPSARETVEGFRRRALGE
ncbi:MAG: tetratricopeptide repeat protein, partial [Planctomycetes bacterium]|nr:tetratricopeptide repeat protein [Planctomycetota bacterium]